MLKGLPVKCSFFSFYYTPALKRVKNKFQNESNYLSVMQFFFLKKSINQKDAHKLWADLKRSSVKSPERKVEYRIFYNFILQKYLIYKKTTKKFFLARITRNL